MNPQSEIIERYFQEKREGKDFSEIRRELKSQRYNDDEIASIVRLIDAKLIPEADSVFHYEERNYAKLIGIGLIAVGVLVTLYTFAIADKTGGKYVLFYGPVLSGIGLIFTKKRKRSTRFEKPSRFRK